MNRRLFLRSIIGAGAGAIIAPPLASEVWPFRKIFLPTIEELFGYGLSRQQLADASVQAIELEQYAQTIPNLFFESGTFYQRLKHYQRLRSSWTVAEVNPAKSEIIFIPYKNPEDML